MIPESPVPSQQSTQPLPPQLEDGFSPPAASAQPQDGADAHADEPVNPALWAKSDF